MGEAKAFVIVGRFARRFWSAPVLWRFETNIPAAKRQRTGAVQNAVARHSAVGDLIDFC